LKQLQYILIAVIFAVAANTAFAQDEVKLLSSNYTTTNHPTPYVVYTHFTGQVEVKNLAYEKQVAIHHINHAGEWVDAQCFYVGPSSKPGYEIWEYQIIYTMNAHNYFPDFLQFAIKYNVDGLEFWDNNNGQDYNGQKNYEAPFDGMVRLVDAASWSVNNPTPYVVDVFLTGTVEVKNTAYHKVINIHYNDERGSTWWTESATYVGPSSTPGYEIWEFDFVVESYKGFDAPRQFVIQYLVDGGEHWDNNGGNNYKAVDFMD
jgi:hypothetical protein